MNAVIPPAIATKPTTSFNFTPLAPEIVWPVDGEAVPLGVDLADVDFDATTLVALVDIT